MARLLIAAVLAFLSASIFMPSEAHAVPERRVALVIGNSDYKIPSLSLSNPKNDASDVADELRSLGFDVQFNMNIGKRDMDGVLEKFARLAATADSALFYYAGHAIQYNGKNYLMPVDAELEDEISIRYNLVSVEDARSALDRASGVKIMILDACRNNPIADRFNRLANGGQSRSAATTRGLARIDKTQGMVVAYATAADDVALDGSNSRNSPFTSALIKEMREPGLEIGTMFRRVARDVNDATGGRQRPETSISLLSEYYLNQSDRKIWEDMRETADIPQIQEFLRRYPNSVSALDARYRLDVLQRAQRDREDEEAQAKREAYKKELEEQEAAARAEIAKLQEERKRADSTAAELEAQRQRDEKAQLAALEERRKKDQQDAADRAARQKQEQQQRLAKLEEDRQNAAKLLADKREADQRRQAAEKLAALEQERVKAEQEVAQREEARRKEMETAKQAEDACKNEQTSLDSIGGDEPKLKLFSANSVCPDARVRAQSKLASLAADRERADRACDSEGKQLAVLMKAPGAEAHEKLLELQSSLTCTMLSQKIVEALGRANTEIQRTIVRNSQAELRRVGCYRGAENGEINDATKDALKRVSVKLGKAVDTKNFDEDLLSDLKKLDAPACEPPRRAEPDERPVARQPNSIKTMSRRSAPARKSHPTAGAPTLRAESRPAPAGGAPALVSGTGF